MVEQLGKLVRVNPREVWANEAQNFTPWLRDNIDYLADAVGIDIQLVESEVAVGDFSVDLVGEEPGQNRPVIIENQLERTNHTHLGQLLTYAAGRDGGVVIWVSPEIRPEHRNALEWLNEATRGNLDFFGVELEVLQIEGSDRKAPNFNVVVAPKFILSSLSGGQVVQGNERGQRYQEFFLDLLERIHPGNRRKVGPRQYATSPAAMKGAGINMSFAANPWRFRVELYIDTGEAKRNKRIFDRLFAGKEEFESELGESVNWERLDNRRASRVAWYWGQSVTIMDSPEKLEELKAWAVPSYHKFREVMNSYLENLELDLDAGYQDEFDNEA